MREITTDMVEKILVDLHNSGDQFDEIDVAELAEKVADNNADLKIDTFIRAWAFTYGFEDYFETREDHSTEEVAQDFIEANESNLLDMLRNEDDEEFIVNIMFANGMCDGTEMSLGYYLGRFEDMSRDEIRIEVEYGWKLLAEGERQSLDAEWRNVCESQEADYIDPVEAVIDYIDANGYDLGPIDHLDYDAFYDILMN